MSSFKIFSHCNHYSLFDIRLNQDPIVFQGFEQESTSQVLRGVVVLCLPGPLEMKSLRLYLEGTQKLKFRLSNGRRVDQKDIIRKHYWPPFITTCDKSFTLPAGNYEFPFEHVLPGNTFESIEGIPEASITYQLKAKIRRGKFACDLYAYRNMRIIRMPDLDAVDLLSNMSVENIWQGKVMYSFNFQKYAFFGGAVSVQIHLTPLSKGLEVGEATVRITETREYKPVNWRQKPEHEHKISRHIAAWRFSVKREELCLDTADHFEEEAWAVTTQFGLPKKLRQCTQDLSHVSIKVRHKITLIIPLVNPDGHVSEIRTTCPLQIIMSPNNQFSEEQIPHSEFPQHLLSLQPAIAPPGYGDHTADQLCSQGSDGEFTTWHTTPHSQTLNEAIVGPASLVQSDGAFGGNSNLVPCYASAVRSPYRTQPLDRLLPDYHTVVSAAQAPF